MLKYVIVFFTLCLQLVAQGGLNYSGIGPSFNSYLYLSKYANITVADAAAYSQGKTLIIDKLQTLSLDGDTLFSTMFIPKGNGFNINEPVYFKHIPLAGNYQIFFQNLGNVTILRGNSNVNRSCYWGGDSSNAINRAAAAMDYDGDILLSSGDYVIDQAIVLPKGVNLRGTITPTSDPTNVPDGTKFIRSANVNMIYSVGSNRVSDRVGANSISGIYFIDGSNIGSASWFYAKYSDSIILEDCLFAGLFGNTTTGHTIEAIECWDWRLDNNIFKYTGMSSLSKATIQISNGPDDSSNDWQIFNCRFQEAKGLSVYFNSSDGGSRNSRFWFDQCKWESYHSSLTGGPHISGEASDVFIDQAQFSWCAGNSISIDPSSTRWRIISSMFANNAGYDIHIDSLANRNTIAFNSYAGGSIKAVNHHINLNGTKNVIIANAEYNDTLLVGTTRTSGKYDLSNKIFGSIQYSTDADSITWDIVYKSADKSIFSSQPNQSVGIGGQGSGQINTSIVNIASASNGNDITLLSAKAGMVITIFNSTAANLDVYPSSGDDLGAGINLPGAISAGETKSYTAIDNTNWKVITH